MSRSERLQELRGRLPESREKAKKRLELIGKLDHSGDIYPEDFRDNTHIYYRMILNNDSLGISPQISIMTAFGTGSITNPSYFCTALECLAKAGNPLAEKIRECARENILTASLCYGSIVDKMILRKLNEQEYTNALSLNIKEVRYIIDNSSESDRRQGK